MTKDPGHVLLAIMRTLRSLNNSNKNVFAPLISNFEIFVKNFVLEIEDNEQRVCVYKNIANHYAGIHDPDL